MAEKKRKSVKKRIVAKKEKSSAKNTKKDLSVENGETKIKISDKSKISNNASGKKKQENGEKKEAKVDKKEWIVFAIFGILVVAIYFLYPIVLGNVKDRAILQECSEIEREIAMHPDFQRVNVTCTCASGEAYFDQVKEQVPPEVLENSELRYVVACNILNETKLYPIWRSK